MGKVYDSISSQIDLEDFDINNDSDFIENLFTNPLFKEELTKIEATKEGYFDIKAVILCVNSLFIIQRTEEL